MFHRPEQEAPIVPMTMEPNGTGRLVVSLAVLATLALTVWFTMEPGKFQYFTWLALGFFALRIVLLHYRARYSRNRFPANADPFRPAREEPVSNES